MSSRYCPTCGAQRVFAKPRVNHVLHLLLSIVTAGIWVIVWALIALSAANSDETCSSCGLPIRQPVDEGDSEWWGRLFWMGAALVVIVLVLASVCRR